MAAKNSPRRFIVAFVGLAAAAFAAMASFNIIVDPFWRFNVVEFAGFNAQKNQLSSHVRLAKAGIVCRLQPKTIILGTSRVEVGINPESLASSGMPGPVYNMGFAGSGIYELQLSLQHAAHASSALTHVFVGLDFLMFNANREAVVFQTEVQEFEKDRLLLSRGDTCLRSFLYDIDSYLGPKALAYSLATVRNQTEEPKVASGPAVGSWIANYDRNGFRNNFPVLEKTLIPQGGYRGLFGENQERYYASKVWRPAPKQRYCFQSEGQPDTLAVFRGMLDFARTAGIDLRLFINPVHARLLLAVRDAGLWPQYEDWKKGLVDVIAMEAASSGKPAFLLWDFSGFDSVSTEQVPKARDIKTAMKWFWEPSHYKSELGDLLLRKMLGLRDLRAPVPEDFGRLLTSGNIDDWIGRTRTGMRDYMRTEPDEAALVKSIVDKTMIDSTGANCGYDVDALREGSAARARGDTGAAEAGFERAIAIHEAERRRFAELDVPYRETGFEKTLAQVKAGIEIKPLLRDWIAYQERGIDRSNKGDLAGAIDDFSDAIRLGPANTALFFLRGTTRLRAGDHPGAAEDFEAGLKLDPSNETLKSLLNQARLPAPAKVAASSSTVNPKLAIELQHAADARRKAGDIAGAIVDYGRAIEVSPPNTALYYLRGSARLQTGDRSGAAADFEEGLKLDPVNPTLKVLLEQARAAPVAVVPVQKTNPELAAQLQNAADDKRKAGDLAGAIADYGKAIDVSPPNTALYYLRGTALLQAGDRSGAAADFETGLKLDPGNVTLQSLLTQMRE